MSNALYVLSAIVYFCAGVWGLAIIVPLIYAHFGLGLTAISLFVFPLTLLVVPWYEALSHGRWFLVFLNYGSPLISGILAAMAQSVAERGRA